jgi:signal transduction histidine kinase
VTAVRRTAHVVDAAIAVGTWAFGCAMVLVLPHLMAADPASFGGVAPRGSWLAAAAITAQAVALLRARQCPGVVLCVVAAVPLPVAAALDEATFSLTRVALLVAVFLAGVRVPVRRLRVALAIAAALVAAGEFVNDTLATRLNPVAAIGDSVLQTVSVVVVPLLVALVVAARRDVTAAHRRELRAVAGERDALLAAAVAGERAAMARELHDIAAHHLSGIALLAAAVDRQIDTDPAAARHSVQQVRAQSKAVLEDLRRLVGLLREDSGGRRGVETLAAVPELVADRKAAGLAVDLRVVPAGIGRPLGDDVGPLAQLVAYRMVQESLSNAATHAPGAACTVQIDDHDDAAVVVTVTNEPGHPVPANHEVDGATGFGLIGMRERADLVAGQLSYGPTGEGGWVVTLRIPRNGKGGAP